MNTEDLMQSFQKNGIVSETFIETLENNHDFRVALINHFKHNKNRKLALLLLETFLDLRQNSPTGMSGDNLMLACYLLGLHGYVEDCLKIWNAKEIDFDSFCYVDIQLVPFAGVEKTIAYLKTQTSKEASSALEYILTCKNSGDFNDLENYYSPLPWFV